MPEKRDTYNNLAYEFAVSKETIRHDILVLMCSYPIETVRGRYGGVRIADGYYLYRKSLNPAQVSLLTRLKVRLTGSDLDTLNSILIQFAP